MKRKALQAALVGCAVSALCLQANALSTTPSGTIATTQLWTFAHVGDGDGEGGAEINAYDAASDRVFVTNAAQNRIDIVQGSTGASLGSIALSGGPNSVAISNGVVAVAVENTNKQLNGSVDFYQASTGTLINSVAVGALPDMLTFTPDGSKVIVANEGEPSDDYTVDPEGSVSIIDISGGVASASVTNADFTAFNAQQASLEAAGVQIFGPGATVAQDLEPEYIAVAQDGTKAFIVLQENNAVATLDLASNQITAITAIPEKDHTLPGNQFDASNRDNIDNNQQNWTTIGLAQPDAIDSFEANGNTYYATANEGDARDYDGFVDEERIKDATIDPALEAALAAAHGADWQDDENLGRLKISLAASDTDGDGDLDRLASYGARSFSIFDESGNLVFDSADFLEDLTASLGSFADGRSDDKGPEPEALIIEQLFGQNIMVLGLERTGDVLFFNLDDPNNPEFLHAISGLGLSPEGLTLSDNGDGTATLFVSDELGSQTLAFQVAAVPLPAAVWLFASGLTAVFTVRRKRNS